MFSYPAMEFQDFPKSLYSHQPSHAKYALAQKLMAYLDEKQH